MPLPSGSERYTETVVPCRADRGRGWRSGEAQCAPPVAVCPLALPRVQPDVVMVASGGKDSRSRQADVATVDGDVEAQHVTVEGGRPIEVGDAQVHVPDAHRRVKL
jgi:hypothetical protein